MKRKFESTNYILLFVMLFGCSTKDNYSIERFGLSSKYGEIVSFSISQFKSDSESLEDIRPINHTEVMRYCCEVKKSKNASSHVFFSDTSNYNWSLCLLDTSIVTNDSLNNLSDGEKLKYIQMQNIKNSFVGASDYRIPFIVQKGYIYQLFGLNDLEGSFYFRLSDKGDFEVQFYESGPW